MLDIQTLCQQHSVPFKGAIYICASSEKLTDDRQFQSVGIENFSANESNPATFNQLQARLTGHPTVRVVYCAIRHINGIVIVDLMSTKQEGFTPPPQAVRDGVPSVINRCPSTVTSNNLDTLFQKLELNPSEYNIIDLDVPGRELLILQGATHLLSYIDAIYIKGDREKSSHNHDFLKNHEFQQIDGKALGCLSEEDSFYRKKPLITMSTLGRNGRFANQLFQYAFLKIYARKHDLRVETPTWIGQVIFGHNDPPISKSLPTVKESTNQLAIAKIPHSKKNFENVDFWGYFQYNTSFYEPQKEYFRSLFKPTQKIDNILQKGLRELRRKGKTIIGIHLRRGDYGYGYFFRAPTEWYIKWLKELWQTVEQPVLFIASDEIEKVVDDFANYNPVTSKQLGMELEFADFYPDFYFLSHCDIVAISNSSFSFAACMLNEKSNSFFRPHLPSKKLIPFDPWSSETIFRDAKVEKNLSGVTGQESAEPINQFGSDKIEIVGEKKDQKSETDDGGYKNDELDGIFRNVLICFSAPRYIYRPLIISPNEVFCSPDCQTTFEGEYCRTIQTPVGRYDIEEIIEQIPSSQQPELVIVKADATRRNFPVNLQKIKCPKILICGNTQHLHRPINSLIDYAKEENFDFIMSDHKRHHLHYFKEAGLENIFWVPGFNVYPRPQPIDNSSQYPITFVGQVGKYHPYRKLILQKLKRSNYQICQFKVTQEEATKIYSQSLINLNISLNGDLNLRVFEVLSSGGFLLTDRLSQQSGLELLFEEGRHLSSFKDEAELQYKLDVFLNDPEMARQIAKRGCDLFWKNHSPEVNIKRVFDYINGRDIESRYKIESEKRSVYLKSSTSDELRWRISIYEYLQELHLNCHHLTGLFWHNVDPRLICDLTDLPRLDIHLSCDRNICDVSPLFYSCEVHQKINFIPKFKNQYKAKFWNFIAITWGEFGQVNLDQFLLDFDFDFLIFTDLELPFDKNEARQLDARLERRGLILENQHPRVYLWKYKFEYGRLLKSENHVLSAIEIFNRSLKHDSFQTQILIELGAIAERLGDFKEAERKLRRAVSLERRNAEAIKGLARVLIEENQYPEAAHYFQYLTRLNSGQISDWWQLEKCYRQLGKDEDALRVYHHCRFLEGDRTSSPHSPFSERSQPKSSPKIILVINNLYPPQELGGYGRSICDFANLLQDRGHTIEVLTADAPYLGEIQSPELNVNRNLLLFGTFEKQTQFLTDPDEIARIVRHNERQIQQTIESLCPDVCLVGNINFLGVRIFQPLLENYIPVINHLGLPSLLCPSDEMPTQSFFTLATASEFVRQKAIAQGYPANNTAVIYPGAKVQEFQMCYLPNLEKLRIVYAGLMIDSKGSHTVIEALKLLDDAGEDFECSLAGDSPNPEFSDRLKEFVIRQGMGDRVKFLGYLNREELIELYSTHNVIVFPSIGPEAFGISPVEGMAAGLTAISTGVGGAGEVVEHGVSGLIFPPGDSSALAAALMSLSGDRKRWKRLAETGQHRANSIFDIEHSVDILEETFDRLLNERNQNQHFLKNKIQPELQKNLRLRDFNFILFPDWNQSEDALYLELESAIVAVLTHPDCGSIALLIDGSSAEVDTVNLVVSGIVMNFLMRDDMDIDEEPEISVVASLKEIEWKALLPCLNYRLSIALENTEAIAKTGADSLPHCTPGNLHELKISN